MFDIESKYFLLMNALFEAGSDDQDASGDQDAGGDAGGDDDGSSTNERTFTQAEVNALMKKDKVKLRNELQQMRTLVDQLKKNNNREELETKIEELQSKLMTKEELAERDKKKLQKESESKITELTQKLEQVTSKYTNETLERAITDAAAKHDAYAPEQIVALLRSSARLEEELGDDDEPTGRLVPKVKLTVPSDDGAKELDLAVSDAVKMMRETPEKYGNLFRDDSAGGIGMYGHGRGGREPDLLQIARSGDLKKFREAKAKQKG